MTNDTRKRVTLRLTEKMYSVLKAESEKKGVPINALINEYLWKWKNEDVNKKVKS